MHSGFRLPWHSTLPLTSFLLALLLLLQVWLTAACKRAYKSLQDAGLYNSVTDAFNWLAHGGWPAKMHKDPAVPTQYQAIIHVYEVKGLRLIWMVDVDHNTHKQVGGLCTISDGMLQLQQCAGVGRCIKGCALLLM
jgi:hypothetical protein